MMDLQPDAVEDIAVSTKVNRPANDDPSLIEEVEGEGAGRR
jgi:hypothetical protein